MGTTKKVNRLFNNLALSSELTKKVIIPYATYEDGASPGCTLDVTMTIGLLELIFPPIATRWTVLFYRD